MNDLREHMHRIREEAEGGDMDGRRARMDARRQERAGERELRRLLQEMAAACAAEDGRLRTGPPPASAAFGFSLVCAPGFPPPPAFVPFAVTADCTRDRFRIGATDGHWEEAEDEQTQWGHWTDNRAIYEGPWDVGAIADRLQEAFLRWYRKACEQLAAAPAGNSRR